MKNYRPILLILLVIGVLIIIKILLFPGKEAGGPGMKGKGGGGMPPVAVNIFVAQESTIDNTFYTNGTLLPNEKASIQSEIGGMLTVLNFEEGKHVNKGQLLAVVNDSEWRAQLKKLDAQIKLAQQKKDRHEKLVSSGAISTEEFEASVAELASLQAEADVVTSQLNKATIRAPFSGKLGFRKVSPGSYVSPGTVIGDIVQSSPLKVEFSVPEKNAGMFINGSRITFISENDSAVYNATVFAIEPEVDEATRTIGFHALYANTKNELVPGGFVRVTVMSDKKATGILIPTQAVIPILKGKKVFIARNGKAQEQVIETGLRTDKMIHVTRGLHVGDTVITTGIMSVSNGSPVTFITK